MCCAVQPITIQGFQSRANINLITFSRNKCKLPGVDAKARAHAFGTGRSGVKAVRGTTDGLWWGMHKLPVI